MKLQPCKSSSFRLSVLLCSQFLMYIDSVGSDCLMDMETDGPLLDDVNMLKKTMEEEATQVRRTLPVTVTFIYCSRAMRNCWLKKQ